MLQEVAAWTLWLWDLLPQALSDSFVEGAQLIGLSQTWSMASISPGMQQSQLCLTQVGQNNGKLIN